MLTFAEARTDPKSGFAVDDRGYQQFMRYFGKDRASYRRLPVPLARQEPVDNSEVAFFLLHWPGPAGGLGEQVEYRSVQKLKGLRKTPGWGLVYDNGESYILKVR
jgi:hypothetical protein